MTMQESISAAFAAVGADIKALRAGHSAAAWPPLGAVVGLDSAAPQLEIDGMRFLRAGLFGPVPDAWPAWAGVHADLDNWSDLGSNTLPSAPNCAAVAGPVWMLGLYGRVVRSADNGQSWSVIAMPSAMSSVPVLGVATDGQGVWVAVGWGRIARSTDDGQSWAMVSSSVDQGQSHGGLATDGNGVWLYSLGGGRVARSADNGQTWALVDTGATVHLSCVATDGSGVWVVGGHAGTLRRSSDHGQSWSALPTVMTGRNVLALAYSAGVWMASGAGNGGHITRSTDGGQAWASTTGPLRTVTELTSDGRGLWAGAGVGGKLMFSRDHGQSWALGNAQMPGHAVALATNGRVWLFCGLGRELMRATARVGLPQAQPYQYLRVA
ncbi:MAG: hypothetical protein Q4A97_01690 [Comamonadaceae bacterium]|nr:hypothetical protein [Comamonadaceae bacterium]